MTISMMTTRIGDRVQVNHVCKVGDNINVRPGTTGTVTNYHGAGILRGPGATVRLDIEDEKYGGYVGAIFALTSLDKVSDT